MFFDAALLGLPLLEQCGNLDGQSRQVAIDYAPDDFIPDDVITVNQDVAKGNDLA
jgi:hypothetical protein